MNVSLKARNVPKLIVVWVLNVVVFYGVATGGDGFRDVQALWGIVSGLAASPAHVWASVVAWVSVALLTAVIILNGLVPRRAKEFLVFWPAPRPGSRAFDHFLFRDSTINRKTLEQHFSPLPSKPDEQNALWAAWLNEFADDARVGPAYGLYLFARDWTVVAAFLLIVAAPAALWFSEEAKGVLWYPVALLVQCVLARWLAHVQGEQLVMSGLSCKGSSFVSHTIENDNTGA